MARYIDADKLCEALKNMAAVQEPYKQNTILGVVSSIENFPTADVVPKSELDDLQSMLDATIAGQETLQKALADAKSEVARGIFEEIKQLIIDCTVTTYSKEWGYILRQDYNGASLVRKLAELKKKYTERCTDCKHFVGCECFDGKTCDEYEGEKFFTPADVRQMSPKEIRENYDAIFESMRKW